MVVPLAESQRRAIGPRTAPTTDIGIPAQGHLRQHQVLWVEEKRVCQPHLFCTVLPIPPTCSLYLVHSIEDGLVELFPRVGSKGVISPVRVAQQEEMSEGNGVLFPECHHQLVAEPEENELPRRSRRLALIV